MIALLHNSGTPPYGHFVITATFFSPGKTAIHFLIKTSVMQQPLVHTANGHIFKTQTVDSLIISPREYGHLFEIYIKN